MSTLTEWKERASAKWEENNKQTGKTKMMMMWGFMSSDVGSTY